MKYYVQTSTGKLFRFFCDADFEGCAVVVLRPLGSRGICVRIGRFFKEFREVPNIDSKSPDYFDGFEHGYNRRLSEQRNTEYCFGYVAGANTRLRGNND